MAPDFIAHSMEFQGVLTTEEQAMRYMETSHAPFALGSTAQLQLTSVVGEPTQKGDLRVSFNPALLYQEISTASIIHCRLLTSLLFSFRFC